jgi:hypothetical protein
MPQAKLQVNPGDSRDLLNDVWSLIEEAPRQTEAAVNVRLTALYWQIGNRILRVVLGNERAAYGEQIVTFENFYRWLRPLSASSTPRCAVSRG